MALGRKRTIISKNVPRDDVIVTGEGSSHCWRWTGEGMASKRLKWSSFCLEWGTMVVGEGKSCKVHIRAGIPGVAQLLKFNYSKAIIFIVIYNSRKLGWSVLWKHLLLHIEGRR